MRKCMLCGEDTNGSIGRAGIRWSFICQKCKDVEDTRLETIIKHQAMFLDEIERLLKC